MTLPTFLVIGAMKAGTTSLHRYLGAHPDVFVPEDKEPEFFLGGAAWERGLDWYRSLFASAGAARACGEASTRYTKDPLFPGVAARAGATIPDARLIYVLRHPIDRIRSHHRHAVAEWGHPASLETALSQHRGEYLVPTRYAHQIDCWLEHFPSEQLLVLRSEDLDTDRDTTLAAVFSFLGVDADWRPNDTDRRYNQAGDHRTDRATAHRVREWSAYRAIKGRVPKRLRHAVWKAGSRPAAQPEEAPLSAELEDTVIEILRPDLVRLTELLPGFDCWGLMDGERAP